MLNTTVSATLAAVVIAGTIGGVAMVNTANRSLEEVAFLERLAGRVERAQTIPPQTGEHLERVVARYSTPLRDAPLDQRRTAALERIRTAIYHRTD